MAPIAISPERSVAQLDALTTAFDDTIRFYLNGTRVVLEEIDPEITLLEYLRGIGLTGTKLYVCSGSGHLHVAVLPSATGRTLICSQRLLGRRLRRLYRRCFTVQPNHQAHLPRQRKRLPRSLGKRRREARHHRRGHRECQVPASSPRAYRQGKWLPVWLLHPGNRNESVCSA